MDYSNESLGSLSLLLLVARLLLVLLRLLLLLLLLLLQLSLKSLQTVAFNSPLKGLLKAFKQITKII